VAFLETVTAAAPNGRTLKRLGLALIGHNRGPPLTREILADHRPQREARSVITQLIAVRIIVCLSRFDLKHLQRTAQTGSTVFN
jgi:hypothetical protein